MAQFLDLPRELRDMVYMELLVAERPTPTLGGAQWLFRFRRIFEAHSGHRGEYGCAYSTETPPTTCANLLRCNRQIFAELNESIGRAKRKGRLFVKLDCIAEDESFHYFTWLRIPLVETNDDVPAAMSKMMPAWAGGMIRRYSGLCQRSTTLINQLWVDVRIFGDRAGKFSRNGSAPDRTSWAICAALKRIFDKGPDFASHKDAGSETTIEELVLNVVTQPNVPKEKYLPEDYPTDGLQEGLVHPNTVAQELVNVWQKIWSGDDFKGSFYQTLLERINRVRVCVNGETWRIRELKLELERGHSERQKIAARARW